MKTKSKSKKPTRQPLAHQAYEIIVKRIICLEYQPGCHLEESHLMEDLDIGRTPIREALVRLQSEKLVESHPNRGVVVRPITLQNTKAMFESMSIFEFGVVDIAQTKNCAQWIPPMRQANADVRKAIQANQLFDLVEANHQFHMHFAQCSQNEFLIRAVHDVRSEAKRLSYLSYNTTIGLEKSQESHYESVVKEHDKIITCLEEQDYPALRALLTDHIQTFKERIIQFMVS
ncbi:MAG: GntR family transcriptional regulator [Desulfobacterales bacterium]|nr:GntR family transcriptional regulator [Desulfobacterales bacterium]